MRIAFTHNLQLDACEAQAEFDTPKTITAIATALESLGHVVERVDVHGPVGRLVAQLEALAPDLIFNTAEGTHGPLREAFYPALFEQMQIPYTGCDSYVCALTLDKHLTKTVLQDHDVLMPGGALVRTEAALRALDFTGPLILKPNFEGSSKGINADSVVRSKEELLERGARLLADYPSGILAEEFIVGMDLVVPFLEGATRAAAGLLEPASYRYENRDLDGSAIYDFLKKNHDSDKVEVCVPAAIDAHVRREAMRMSDVAFRALGVRGAARIDLRLGEDGRLYFIEINALPSLEPGASIYESAKLAGLETMPAVLETIIGCAGKRFGLQAKLRARKPRAITRVGLTFNLKGSGDADADAEYDSRETIDALAQAIRSLGHDAVELEANADLLAKLPTSQVDVVFNIAEGLSGRNRESHVPSLLELMGVPYTGSDPTTLGVALDKVLAKRLVRQAGLATPDFVVMTSGNERLPRTMTFPLIVKPAAEGSSKGVVEASVVENEAELRALVTEMTRRFAQDALVEAFLPGREFTVGLLGERRPRALPVMEIVLPQDHAYPTYSYARKFEGKSIRFDVPARIDRKLEEELSRVARSAFRALGCRDVARIDLRLDAAGVVHFIECNPLPGLSPGFSDLCVIAEAAGMDYTELIRQILAPALRRMRIERRARDTSAVLPGGEA